MRGRRIRDRSGLAIRAPLYTFPPLPLHRNMPAPAATATAIVAPVSSVVVTVVAEVTGGASPVMEKEVGVYVAVTSCPSAVPVRVTGTTASVEEAGTSEGGAS